jgi:hypothetical protein
MQEWLYLLGRPKWLVALFLLIPCAAAAESLSTPPNVAEFREGDFWESIHHDRGTITYRLTDGKWVKRALQDPSPNNAQRFVRLFRNSESDEPFPAVHPDGTFFATSDGRLFGFRNQIWKPIPIGSHLGGRKGMRYTVDVRVTPYEAEQLTQIFYGQGLGPHPAGIQAGDNTSIFPTAKEIAALEQSAAGKSQVSAIPWTLTLWSAFGLLFGAAAAFSIGKWQARRRSGPST